MVFDNIILITADGCRITKFFDEDLVINIDSIRVASTDLIEKYHEEDSLYDLLCKKIEAITVKTKTFGIVISFQLNTYNCFSIAHHIRLHNFFNQGNNCLPIILTNPKDVSLSSSSFTVSKEYGILKNGGVCFINEENLMSFQPDLITGKLPIIEKLDKLISNFNYQNYLNNLKVEADETTSRHQISNEWGSLRLSRNSGFSDDEMEYLYPPTLYFKYLSKKFKKNEIKKEVRAEITKEYLINEKLSFSNHPYLQKNRILLIDDNSEKGWNRLLEKIFNSAVKCKQTIQEVFGIDDYCEYDLVFLDLYLRDKSIYSNQFEKESSLILLSELKKKFPQVPIIIFTASNKSWTLNEVNELGADGMYVKESPEYAGEKVYSNENFKNFVDTISKVLDKYKILRPYWEAIQAILESSNFKTIPEKKGTKFKERIEERLKMFYGLLKKGYEQSSYDKETFFYSDYELAFMTLWSLLNEIQEASFDKINISLIHSNGNTYSHHPDSYNTPLSKKQQWVLKNSGKIFINNAISFCGSEVDGNPKLKKPGKYDLQADTSMSDLNYDKWKSPYYSIDSTGKFLNNDYITKSLHTQIAYILLNRNSNTNTQLIKLHELNKIRNSMYLTHGDSIDPNFFAQTEEAKRTNSTITPNHDIKNLFDLVAYLLSDDPSFVISF